MSIPILSVIKLLRGMNVAFVHPRREEQGRAEQSKAEQDSKCVSSARVNVGGQHKEITQHQNIKKIGWTGDYLHLKGVI